MKLSFYLSALLFTSLLVQAPAQAGVKIVYGEDSRKEIKAILDPRIQILSQAIAGRVPNFTFKKSNDKKSISFEAIPAISHEFGGSLCEEERFSEQPIAADCTGFLVSDELFVTAGHCVVHMGQTVKNGTSPFCKHYSWLFDYKLEENNKTKLEEVSADNIYGCQEIVYATWQETEDFAVIKLKRKVKNRKPLTLSKKEIDVNTKISVMGHPSGLPMKYASDGKVFNKEKGYFSTNLDTFGGNSGSPVFNEKTLEVSGILVRGDIDYVPVVKRDGTKCMKVNICNDEREDCREDAPGIDGEHVSYISRIFEFLE